MKILCLGANTQDSDVRASSLAKQKFLFNRGLIDNQSFVPKYPGVYHTSVCDLAIGAIVEISKYFNLVVMFDQPKSIWPNWKNLQSTYKLMVELESQSVTTQFRSNDNIKPLEKIERMVIDNPSWCIYPWINIVNQSSCGDDSLRLCARSSTVVAKTATLSEWHTSTVRRDIQNKMLKGEIIPDSCSLCYNYEKLGIESYRQFESKDWLNQLDISEFDQLDKINSPRYYEIAWSNRCNIKCRGCVPSRSSAIETEFKRHQVIMPWKDSVSDNYPPIDIVDIENLDHLSRVYITGGEPLIMPETVEFMRRCVAAGRTDFELTMSTNGVKVPEEFLNLAKKFTNLNLSLSLDGFEKINDYWRSGSKWARIVQNMHLFKEQGILLTINTVPGIYNVTNLHLLFEWLDQEFPNSTVYLQISHVDIQSAYNHPDPQAVMDSMERCKKTQVYWSDGKSCRSGIDSIYNYYKSGPECNIDNLRGFFQYNDQLDSIRGVFLKDHIPELEKYRYLVKEN
jgi:sulfatase maturation enzyme AslB (radical SAM superfamily)